MRNAVIRKKHLKAQRVIEDFIRMPQRIIFSPDADISLRENWNANINSSLWAI